MNELQLFKNDVFEVGVKIEDGAVLFDVEAVAKNLGIAQKKNGVEYIRWERVNEYLPKNSPEVGKGDLIPEPLVYKLAFKANNEVAEQFQDWLAIEVIPQIRKTGSYAINTAQLSPELQMFNQLFTSLARTELKQNEQDQRLKEVEQTQKALQHEQQNITEIVSLNPNNWKDKVSKILSRIAQARGGSQFEYQAVRNESYELLEQRGRCKLGIRLENRKKDALAEGKLSKSKISKFTKIDVIAADARLTEIYLAIVKEMAIANKVHVEGLGA